MAKKNKSKKINNQNKTNQNDENTTEVLQDDNEMHEVDGRQSSKNMFNLEDEPRGKKYVAMAISLGLIGMAVFLIAYFVAPFVRNNAMEYVPFLVNSEDVKGTQVVDKPSVFEDKLAPIYDSPNRLYFDTHSIDISLVQVGLEEGGRLENPEEWNKGGWYSRSARPGENGNIIINAHYDNNYGAPAAFWELKNVQVNDRVFLVDELGKIYTYNVTDFFYIDTQDPDRLSIFDEVEEKSELTLVTCGGIYFPGSGYNKRLVVKAHLQEYNPDQGEKIQSNETALLSDD